MLPTIEYDRGKAESMVERLLEAYQNDTHIFERCGDVPEIRLSEGMEPGKKHALTLFYTIALDAMRQSEYVYRAGKRLAANYDIESLAEMNLKQLSSIMQDVMDDGVGNPSMIIFDASRRLKEKYDGDPRNIFDVADMQDVRERLHEFYGINYGKSALMIKNFQRFGYTPFNNSEMPIKIDRHAIRESIGNGVVNINNHGSDESSIIHFSKIKKQNGTMLEDIFLDITKSNDLDAVALDDAKYMLGSRVCARKSHRACIELCPLECDMLVQMSKSGSYIEYPSDVRGKFDKANFYTQGVLF